MSARSIVALILSWAFFTLVIGLLQLWVGAYVSWLRVEPTPIWESLKLGALLYYANGVVFQVVRDGGGDWRRLLERQKDAVVISKELDPIYFNFVPAIVLTLATATYITILTGDRNDRTLIAQWAIVGLALLNSITYHLLKSSRLSEAAQRRQKSNTRRLNGRGA